jgi:hypothetical protein
LTQFWDGSLFVYFFVLFVSEDCKYQDRNSKCPLQHLLNLKWVVGAPGEGMVTSDLDGSNFD